MGRRMVEKRDRDLTVVFCGCVCFVELEVCVAFARIEMRRSGEESERRWELDVYCGRRAIFRIESKI